MLSGSTYILLKDQKNGIAYLENTQVNICKEGGLRGDGLCPPEAKAFYLFKVDKNAKIRNQYNRIQHQTGKGHLQLRRRYNKNSTSEKTRGQLFPNRWRQSYPK